MSANIPTVARIPNVARPARSHISLVDVTAPPQAALTMPKQVLARAPGGMLRSLRSMFWTIVPGRRRLG
ncbi:hypothetical protein [Cypionkella sp.]|uniref:hypothetical protein n=1 Tax=Cypionkella sp. TaxID=2811411 RepID=UPI0026370BA9|nr:hypothetical protein [Cypionkella sp.]